ncbi:MAG TPA: hypothetical protein VE821_03440, partial [Pyrinomonadaceae bacterium]|nr:hypothetical protein [Pyrinomonadaceae bacterium]
PARLLMAQGQTHDLALAQQYFQEAQAICTRDHGRLWGVSLCGPMLLVDPATRVVFANQADAKVLLTRRGAVFVGHWPEEENIANTAVSWAGAKWTMIRWPLPTDEMDRKRLMMHELFHRVQDEINLPAANPSNDHLDARDGRVWLQLEWRALRAALMSDGVRRQQAITDALTFRAYRRSLFPQASGTERGLEMNEGLAEYTGVRLGAQTEAQALDYARREIENAHQRPTFARSFAYISGPAYGLLLDATAADWRKGLNAQADLGALLAQAAKIKLPANLQTLAEQRADEYDGQALRAAEDERAAARQKQLAEYRAQLVKGPTLVLPLTERMRYSFDPNNVVPLDGAGTVYPTLRVTDEWGILEVSHGALMTRASRTVSKVYVAAPTDAETRPLKGDGWTLQLNDGWRLTPAERKGDFTLQKMSTPQQQDIILLPAHR